MRRKSEIDETLNKIREKKNQLIMWDTKEIDDDFLLVYDAKNIFENNNVKDTERIIKEKRNKIIEELNALDITMKCAVMKYGSHARMYDIKHHDLTKELRLFNWILERYEFDRTISTV